jgi:hypothetical protein
LNDEVIDHILAKNLDALPAEIVAVIELSSGVTRFQNAPEARAKIIEYYGEKGLIELLFAMNGAALLPGIKREMGYATSCNLDATKANASTVKIKRSDFKQIFYRLCLSSLL